ncbi:hypothetical protein [Corynebacterium flavescens]|uniref:hypothetical protein n=1 Tax=Corynebacterium flavescens TaxID=28028 RepID=UPI0028984635|nr:hypothetical protein [Corynebacterium flavescens]
MTQYFFTHSIAPVSYGVKLLRFPVETVVEEFEKWASGFDSPYTQKYLHWEGNKVECDVHIRKAAAGRSQLAELIKPQNHILQFVFVPTNSEWTAVFGPCSFRLSPKIPFIDEFSYYLALKQEIASRIPYFISVEHEPWVDTSDVAFLHRASYGKLCFMMCALPSDLSQNQFVSQYQFDCYVSYRLVSERITNADGTRGRSMSFISGRTEPFKDYGFDFDSLPEVTKFPKESFTDEQARIMWSQFGEKQVEDILAPLGVSLYDDAFYGTEGYLVRLTPAQVADPYTGPFTRRLVEAKDYDPPARIPLEKYQFFQGLHDGPIRSWSSIPISE